MFGCMSWSFEINLNIDFETITQSSNQWISKCIWKPEWALSNYKVQINSQEAIMVILVHSQYKELIRLSSQKEHCAKPTKSFFLKDDQPWFTNRSKSKKWVGVNQGKLCISVWVITVLLFKQMVARKYLSITGIHREEHMWHTKIDCWPLWLWISTNLSYLDRLFYWKIVFKQ